MSDLPKATQSESGGRAGKQARLLSEQATPFLLKKTKKKKKKKKKAYAIQKTTGRQTYPKYFEEEIHSGEELEQLY